MDIGKDAGGDGEGDGRVDKDGEVRKMVEIAALVQWRRLLLGLGARRGLGGLPRAGPLRPPTSAPTGLPARGPRRLGPADSAGLFWRRLVKQAFGVRVGVRAKLLVVPGFALEELVSHWREARRGVSACSGWSDPDRVEAQRAAAGLRLYFYYRGGGGVGRSQGGGGGSAGSAQRSSQSRRLLLLAPASATRLLQRLAVQVHRFNLQDAPGLAPQEFVCNLPRFHGNLTRGAGRRGCELLTGTQGREKGT